MLVKDRKRPISRMNKAELQQECYDLIYKHNQLAHELNNGFVASTVVYTLERDMRAGESIQIRVPKKFMIQFD